MGTLEGRRWWCLRRTWQRIDFPFFRSALVWIYFIRRGNCLQFKILWVFFFLRAFQGNDTCSGRISPSFQTTSPDMSFHSGLYSELARRGNEKQKRPVCQNRLLWRAAIVTEIAAQIKRTSNLQNRKLFFSFSEKRLRWKKVSNPVGTLFFFNWLVVLFLSSVDCCSVSRFFPVLFLSLVFLLSLADNKRQSPAKWMLSGRLHADSSVLNCSSLTSLCNENRNSEAHRMPNREIHNPMSQWWCHCDASRLRDNIWFSGSNEQIYMLKKTHTPYVSVPATAGCSASGLRVIMARW